MTAMNQEAPRHNEESGGHEDRRADPRYGLDENAQLLLVQHGATLACRIVDLSLSGCRLQAQERFPATGRVRVEVAFRVRGLAFRFSGVTQWTDGRQLVGIRFADVPPRRREELVEALAEVSAEVAAREAEKKAAEGQAAAALPVDENAPSLRVEHEAPLPTPSPVPATRATSGFPAAQSPVSGSVQNPSPLPSSDRIGARGLPPSVPPAWDASSADAPSQPAQRERRAQAREAVDVSAVIDLIRISSRLEGRILDLSLGG
ncbi:MAG: PilZ domain-containing protein, partial [Terracidiphilus sp.]